MSSNDKIKSTHLDRSAYVYVRQSTATQVQHNRESTRRQYKLVDRAVGLGCSPSHSTASRLLTNRNQKSI